VTKQVMQFMNLSHRHSGTEIS